MTVEENEQPSKAHGMTGRKDDKDTFEKVHAHDLSHSDNEVVMAEEEYDPPTDVETDDNLDDSFLAAYNDKNKTNEQGRSATQPIQTTYKVDFVPQDSLVFFLTLGRWYDIIF